MSSIISKLESILFVASKPLGSKKLAKVLNVTEDEIKKEAENLKSVAVGSHVTVEENEIPSNDDYVGLIDLGFNDNF